jgi:hypothetical protein
VNHWKFRHRRPKIQDPSSPQIAHINRLEIGAAERHAREPRSNRTSTSEHQFRARLVGIKRPSASAARSPDPPLRHRRDRQRQLEIQKPRRRSRSPRNPAVQGDQNWTPYGVKFERRLTAVMPYAGQEYTLSVAAGAEPKALLCTIDAALMAGQWKRIPSSDSITVDTKCGTVGNIPLPGLSAPDVA